MSGLDSKNVFVLIDNIIQNIHLQLSLVLKIILFRALLLHTLPLSVKAMDTYFENDSNAFN